MILFPVIIASFFSNFKDYFGFKERKFTSNTYFCLNFSFIYIILLLIILFNWDDNAEGSQHYFVDLFELDSKNRSLYWLPFEILISTLCIAKY